MNNKLFCGKSFKEIWDELGNISIDENDNIDIPFYNYPAGTPNIEIWHDLEDFFGVSIGKYIEGNKDYKG